MHTLSDWSKVGDPVSKSVNDIVSRVREFSCDIGRTGAARIGSATMAGAVSMTFPKLSARTGFVVMILVPLEVKRIEVAAFASVSLKPFTTPTVMPPMIPRNAQQKRKAASTTFLSRLIVSLFLVTVASRSLMLAARACSSFTMMSCRTLNSSKQRWPELSVSTILKSILPSQG